MTRRDRLTTDLFAVPQPAAPVAASMDYRATVAHLLADMLAACGMDRYEVAARASRLAGKDVSKYMLDAYTAPSREEFNLPAWLVPVTEAVCNDHRVTAWLAGVGGGRLYLGADALAAELGRIEQQRDALHDSARVLKDTLRRSRNG